MLEDIKAGSGLYNITKLGEENYRSWKMQVELILNELNYLELVEGKQEMSEGTVQTTKGATMQGDQGGGVDVEFAEKLAAWQKEKEKGLSCYQFNLHLPIPVIILSQLCNIVETTTGNVDATNFLFKKELISEYFGSLNRKDY
jgi:hypothetical protein